MAKNSFAKASKQDDPDGNGTDDGKVTRALLEALKKCRKNDITQILMGFDIKEGETSPPKRYNSGSIILAMENAGQLIEDEELRAQIKGKRYRNECNKSRNFKKT